MIGVIVRFCLDNKLVVCLSVAAAIFWGIQVAPFDWPGFGIPRDPVPVDAIPDIGENQQIVFTEWEGRSPQDVEDQITYPLTSTLLGMPGVKTVRAESLFGFSVIYVIFDDSVEFYWSRTRVLERLNSLPAGTLPDGVQPMLGPDATGLGQVFWYTLEGLDPEGKAAGGFDLQELRSIQDWYVRFNLQAVDGVAEVASIGGFVREYQVDVDPDALRVYGVTLGEVFNAIRASNLDVGARTLEINRVEYVIRSRGFIRGLTDIENTVVKVNDNVPIFVRNIARVTHGPALRRGALDKDGTEAVGGVVTVRFGENPLAVIRRVQEKVKQMAPGLPKRTLEDGTVSQVTVVPYYDRTGLILETLNTLNTALSQQILITIIVILLMVMHFRSSLLISGLLPLSVLVAFITMKIAGVDANIVSLSGIAIAIGTIVDMGIILCENILRALEAAKPEESRREVIFRATTEVGSAVLTAVATTIVSFLPVFAMEAAEGKLFKPLAFTKTFVLAASILITLTVIPPLFHLMVSRRQRRNRKDEAPSSRSRLPAAASILTALATVLLLSGVWTPLGVENRFSNLLFIALLIGGLLGGFTLFRRAYPRLLAWCLMHRALFLCLPGFLVFVGFLAWLGWGRVLGFTPAWLQGTRPFQTVAHVFPGMSKEFMPSLDEGSFLYMPTTMPHASIGEAMDVIQKQDLAIRAIPEVENVVGKIGRTDSPMDPAPVSMIETVITYIPEYRSDAFGNKLRYRYDKKRRDFARDDAGQLIPEARGRPYRQWRPEIRSPDDIWERILKVAAIPGTTSAPRLQPIEARLVMLQSGMRAPMGIKIYGPDQKGIETIGLKIEALLKQVPSVNAEAVLADRIVGKPYIEIIPDRSAMARFGVAIQDFQHVIEVAVGGVPVTRTVEGRERYVVRVRYPRELRDHPSALERVLVPAMDGAQVPLSQLAAIRYTPGPQMIRSEETFLVGYVLFDKRPGYSEVDVVNQSRDYLESAMREGRLSIPAGYTYKFAGSYENQVRSEQRLKVVLPLALFVIFMILYLQFRSTALSFLIFSGVFVAWSGGFLMLWLYNQPWFLNFSIGAVSLRELFNVHPYNLSVAVWVGFLALFGIATDDGVVMATYLKQSFAASRPRSVAEIHEAVIQGAMKRIRPCLMTSATTILALLPVLTSRGRGSDIMVPMAIPSFGGMTVVLITVFVVPVLYCAIEESRLKRGVGENSD